MTQSSIDQIIKPNEQLLWSGAPEAGLRLQSADIISMLFGLFAVCFGWFWTYHAVKGAGLFGLVGMIVIASGLWQLFGRKFVEYKTRGRTHYAVTDRRVIISSGYRRAVTKSLDLSTLVSISLSEGRNGIGDIDFGELSKIERANPQMAMLRSLTGFNPLDPPRIQMVRNPGEVYDIIIEARNALRAASQSSNEYR